MRYEILPTFWQLMRALCDFRMLPGSVCERCVIFADFLVLFGSSCERYVIFADFWVVNPSDMRYLQTFWQRLRAICDFADFLVAVVSDSWILQTFL